MKSLCAALLLSLVLIGCQSKLEKGGAYAPVTTTVVNGVTNVVERIAPNKPLFLIDSAFDLADSAVITVCDIERRNRHLLRSMSPKIKHTMDGIRQQANAARYKYAVARKAYLENPTPAGLSELQTILGQLQQLSAAAQAALPKQ